MAFADLSPLLSRTCPGAVSPRRVDWREFETLLAVSLPSDYKQLIDAYGAGTFHDFLHVFSPASTKLDLLPLIRRTGNSYRRCRPIAPEWLVHAVYPEPAGLLAWGVTDNGDTLFWRTEGDPDRWTVVLYDSKWSRHEAFPVGMTEFLANWLGGTINPRIFPRDSRAFGPLFRPVDE